MEPTRIAIVGLGVIAPSHLTAVRAAGDRANLVGIVDVREDRLEAFAEKHGIERRYTDLATMLDQEHPNLVQICTPPWLHSRQIIQCLKAGASVLCEKPICGSLAQLDQIRQAESETGRFCASVFQWRFGSAAQHFHRLIDEGTLGRRMVGLCDTMWYRDAYYYAKDQYRGTWEGELGGSTVTQGIHLMDLFLWLMGEWRDVTATIGTLDHAIEIEDLSMAMVRFANGAMGSIVNSVVSPRQESYVRLDLQKATIEVRALYRYANHEWSTATAPGVDDAVAQQLAIVGDVPSGHPAQLAAVLDRLERGERPPVATDEVRIVLDFISSLYKSAATGTTVQRGSIAPGDPFYTKLAGTLTSVKVGV